MGVEREEGGEKRRPPAHPGPIKTLRSSWRSELPRLNGFPGMQTAQRIIGHRGGCYSPRAWPQNEGGEEITFPVPDARTSVLLCAPDGGLSPPSETCTDSLHERFWAPGGAGGAGPKKA